MNPSPEPNTASRWVVMKFGGTSVSSPALWRQIEAEARRVLDDGDRALIVVSAIRGITDGLAGFVDQPGAEASEAVFNGVRERHLKLLEDLGLPLADRTAAWLNRLQELLAAEPDRQAEPAHQAEILCAGEMLSSSIGTQVLERAGLPTAWVDARTLLCSTPRPGDSPRARHLSAQCLDDVDSGIQRHLTAPVCITQGFVARNEAGETVVLGRGGSDTSGAYLAAKLDARRLEIWTDVPGLFSANPHRIPGARLLRHLGYREAQELASMGARVLHPRCIGPVRRHAIPLHLRQTSRPDIEGTVISDHARDFGAQVKAIVHRPGITLIAMEGLSMWHQVGFLADAFEVFKRHGWSVDLVSTSEANVTVSLDLDEHLLDDGALAALVADLEPLCRVHIVPDCASVSLVGLGIRTILHRLGPALEVFEQRRIHLVSQASNDLNLTFVVDQGDAEKLVQQLHRTLIPGGIGGDSVFGETWEQLFRDERAAAMPERWWRREREGLLETLGERDCAFVYHRPSLRQAAARLHALGGIDRVFYAMKANPHPEVLRELAGVGLGIECVSPEEIDAALAAVPGLTPDRILFTPNFAARREYRRAAELGVNLTIDNLFVLEQWGADLAGREILVRLDPGSGLGHHKLVRTAGVHAKFGVPADDLPALHHHTRAHGIRVIGLHAHTGSGILHPDAWHRTLEVLSSVAEQFPDLRVVDIGGGFGVPDKQDELPLDTRSLDEGLQRIRDALPRALEIWIEPGRYLVAEAGVLLARVTQTKGKGEVQYVGVATGMNSLIRPALYGAYHEIHNLSRIDQPAEQVCNVVGPICETGDILGLDRLLPRCREGDVLLIANTGAYGRAMSSRYNLREPAPELMMGSHAE